MELSPIYQIASQSSTRSSIQEPYRRPENRAAQAAVNSINQSSVFGVDRKLQYLMDPRSRTEIFKVVDTQSGQMVLQVPSQLVLNLAQIVEQAGDKSA